MIQHKKERFTKREEKKKKAEMVSEFLETSQVLDYFRNTDPYQSFHTGSRVFLQRQENQRKKEGSESKMKVVRLDIQFELLKMPAMADGVSF